MAKQIHHGVHYKNVINNYYILAAVVNEVDLAAEAAGSAANKDAGDANDSLPTTGIIFQRFPVFC